MATKNKNEQKAVSDTETKAAESTDVKSDANEVDEKLAIEQEIKAANERADEMKLLAQRVQADFENFRKRNNEAVKDARLEGENGMLQDILGVLDSFERALSQLTDEKTKNDVSQIYKQFQNFFTSKGVEEIAAEGQMFDPQIHNAVMTVEDKEREGQIVDVLIKGYKRGNKTLRLPAVRVAK